MPPTLRTSRRVGQPVKDEGVSLSCEVLPFQNWLGAEFCAPTEVVPFPTFHMLGQDALATAGEMPALLSVPG